MVARSVFTARSMLTGAPICIALADVFAAVIGSYRSKRYGLTALEGWLGWTRSAMASNCK